MENTMLSSIGTFLTGLLNSSQLQSLGRTALKIGGALLVAKYGIDPNNVASVVGGIAAAAGIVSSIKTHATAPSATPLSITDVVNATAQVVLSSVGASAAASATSSAPSSPASA
jgi:hypothetical protein